MSNPLTLDADLARSALDELELGVVVCDEAIDRIMLANSAAQRILSAFDAATTRLPEALREALAGAADRKATSRGFSPTVAHQLPSGRRLFLRSKPLGERSVLVTMTGGVLREAELFALLRRRFLLTWREFQIVSAVRAGHGNDEVAEQLEISVGTVKQYLNKIFKSFDVRSRGELAAIVERLAREGGD